jgi:hypothetical protein
LTNASCLRITGWLNTKGIVTRNQLDGHVCEKCRSNDHDPSLVSPRNRQHERGVESGNELKTLPNKHTMMIEPEAEDFGKCKVSVKDYAELTGLKVADLYPWFQDIFDHQSFMIRTSTVPMAHL